MAKEAGLVLPRAKVFPSRKGYGFFGVKRFDRIHNNAPVHMHSLSGLLHARHWEPSLDYLSVMKATMYLTKNIGQCEIQFRNAVFNVLSYNRDDHSKNFSFLMDSNGVWTVSPAYDLTYSHGPGGEHSTMMMGEGRYPGKDHLLRLAKSAGIQNAKALEIIYQVVSAVKKWPQFASDARVSHLSARNIESSLSLIRKNGFSDF